MKIWHDDFENVSVILDNVIDLDLEKGEPSKMKKIQFRRLDDCIECYGRENLVAIDTLPQIIFYTSKGVQPKYVSENQTKQGKISCWFLKTETAFVYKLWQNSNPKKTNKNGN